jgi:hypothetical protein
MATVPTPYDATAGGKASAAAFDAGVKDLFAFMLAPPRCAVWNSVGQVITPAATPTVVLYDTETDDNDSMHSTSSNTGRIVFNTAGRYELNVFNSLSLNTLTQYNVQIRLNGATSIRTAQFGSPGGSGRQTCISLSRVFAALDYIEILVTTNAIHTMEASGQYCTGIQAIWVANS